MRHRVFISYTSTNRSLVTEIADAVECAGLEPVWDTKFTSGRAFLDQIKLYIAQAHIFMPVLTRSAKKRSSWVHEEIGYALAMGVPVLPVSVGILPGEMIQGLNAIRLNRNSIRKQLTREVFAKLIRHHEDTSLAPFVCADTLEERTSLIIRYANTAMQLFPKNPGCVRQKAALSSFHLPKEVVSHEVWTKRSDPNKAPRSKYICKLLRNERTALEKHVKKAGCKLIIDPTLSFKGFGRDARIARLRILHEFLVENRKNKLVKVVMGERIHEHDNILIVGDWFYCSSVAPTVKGGYRQTIFTRHAPTMQERIEEFDQEFRSLLGRCSPQTAKNRVIAFLAKQLKTKSSSAAKREASRRSRAKKATKPQASLLAKHQPQKHTERPKALAVPA